VNPLLHITEHFLVREALCPCCNVYDPVNAAKLAKVLELVRLYTGPLVVRSWHRCIVRNRVVGGVTNSAHLRSFAVDIFVPTMQYRFSLVHALLGHGVTRIGTGASVVHADIDASLPHRVLWYYGGDEPKVGV
jgi:uncharacterized protein YcbK (DUF882 family)